MSCTIKKHNMGTVFQVKQTLQTAEASYLKVTALKSVINLSKRSKSLRQKISYSCPIRISHTSFIPPIKELKYIEVIKELFPSNHSKFITFSSLYFVNVFSHTLKMTHQSSIKFPIIDFSKIELVPGSPEWDSIKQQVYNASEEYGFFEAVYDKVPLDLHAQLFASSKQLLDLPFATKLGNSSERPFRGYIPQAPSVSLYESVACEDVQIAERAKTFTNNMWPEGNASFCKTVHSWAQQVVDLEQLIRRMVLESLGVEKYVDEHMKSNEYIFRFIKYEPHSTGDDKVGVISHTDKTTISILSQNQVNGLEVQTKDGQWMNVKFSPNSFVVMMGDAFMAWTNGRVHSPHHRVIMKGSEARYSVALFAVPKAGYIVKAPEELVDEEHPLLFKPYDHEEFFHFSNTPEGYTSKYPLKAYCGV